MTDIQAALLTRYKQPLTIEPVELDAPRAGEVRVRMASVGICHTDLVFMEGGAFSLPTPCILGHEGAGVVEAVGAGVTSLAPGDHVVLTFNTCGDCVSCARGLPSYCLQIPMLNYAGGRPDGTSPVARAGERINAAFFSQSSFATHAIAAERNAIKVDKAAPLELLGPLGCGFMTGAGGVMLSLAMKAGDSLAIFGGGAVGLSALLAARAIGAGPLIVVEPVAQRRELALELGATHALAPGDDVVAQIRDLTGGGVTHALDATGIPAVVAQAAEVLLPAGTLGTAGIPPLDANLPINMLSLMSRGIAVKGICEGDADPATFIPQMVALFLEGRFPIDRLITRFPFERINEAIAASTRGDAVKALLVFDNAP